MRQFIFKTMMLLAGLLGFCLSPVIALTSVHNVTYTDIVALTTVTTLRATGTDGNPVLTVFKYISKYILSLSDAL